MNLFGSRALEFSHQENMRLIDILVGDVGITMVATLTGGVSVMLYPSFRIFQNKKRSYLIGGLRDKVPGVAY